jgi:hypothetical protein
MLTSGVVAVLPLLALMLSGVLAVITGCSINEGTVNTCQLGPVDIGSLLYTLFVSGWLIFISFPLGALGCGIGVLVLVVQLVSNRQQNRDR